ncbi:MAG: neutral/alkaline non-lysosomal ceramidase N-terminal domain-containing protein [Planctomycetota bacterium]
MSRILMGICMLCLLVLALPLFLVGAGLKAGVAKVEITPPTGLRMYGYAQRKEGVATSVLDPLFARVLVLETGGKRLALVVMDLGRVPAPAWIERLREDVKKTSGIPYVLIAATHTHSGPAVRDEYPPREAPDWETGVLDKVEKAITDAHQRAMEARLGTGYGTVDIGHNRIRVMPDGTVTMLWNNPTRVPTAPVDPTVSVLRVDTAEGKPLAILVNYACHPVVFGPDNMQYSADYPGVMINIVEQAFGGKPLGMFLQGGGGDIDPYYAVHPLQQDAVKMRDWTGERLGQEAARVAKSIQTAAVPDATLDVAEDLLEVHMRWNPEKFREAVVKSWGPEAAETFDRQSKKVLRLPVATVLINKRIALMTLPGEPFVELQMAWRSRCPVRDAFFLGYCNGSFDYFPTIRAASLGGYGAANSSTWVELGAGERMVDHAIIKVYEMLGLLADTPEDLKK